MSAALGLRGTGAFRSIGTPGSTDESPKNWREMMLFLFPNGEMPLTALLSKLKNQPTDDPEFNWWEKGLPTQRLSIDNVSNYSDTDTSLVVDTPGATYVKKSHVLLVERTGEILFVTADPANATTIVVARGKGETAAAAILDGDFLYIIGTVNEEGADAPSIITYTPTKVYNYTQIFKTTLGQTRTAKKTRLRWDKTGPYREAKREALQIHGIELEKAFMWGQRLEEVGPDGQPRRTTRGVRTFITTNVLADANADGSWTDAEISAAWEEVFRYGSTIKLGLAGSRAIATITQWAKAKSVINLVPTDEVYGLKIVEILTPFGNLYLKNHPLMSDHPVYRKDIVILDTENLQYRYIDDTSFIRNIQAPGVDANKDMYISECGLELWHEKTHAVMKNLSTQSG